MKIKVSLDIDGDDQWTFQEGSSWGQTKKQSHFFEVTFDDDINQLEAVSSAIERLILSLSPPRPLLLVAHMVAGLAPDPKSDDEDSDDEDSDLPQSPDEESMVTAAQALIDGWEKHDEALEKLVKECKESNP